MNKAIRTYRARWIIPVSSSPIQNGWLQTDGRHVLRLGQGTCPVPHEDLGDVAILPQLVNAHTHLEFSHLGEPIGMQGISLADWIGLVIASRDASISRDDSVRWGLEKSKLFGVSLVAEITTPPCDYARQGSDPWLACFAEVLGLSKPRSDQRMRAAFEQMELDPWCGLSPHAPYSTTRETIVACVEYSRQAGRSIAMHVAESSAERQLLTQASGPLDDSLQRLGVLREGLFPWGQAPFEWLIDTLAQSSRALLVHGNDLRENEIAKLSPHHHLSVVYCPRTHAYFGYDEHPVIQLMNAGVRVAIGTDSLASNPDLSVWGEVQYLLKHRPEIDAAEVLCMATMNGADALGYPKLGRIEVGCDCRLGLVDSQATTIEALHRDWAEMPFRPMSVSRL